jgi:GT2 family glycosyltransferase
MIAAIPTMYLNNCYELVKMLSEIENGFERIFVLNNSSKRMEILETFVEVVVVNFGKNIGVNASWNYAIEQALFENQDLAILNDDIVVKPNFIKNALNVLNSSISDKIGILVPFTVHDMNIFNSFPLTENNINLSVMMKREGWCMFLKNKFMQKMHLIPDELKTFCGDDWIFHQAVINNFCCYKDNLNIIFHEIGKTMRKHPEIRRTLKNEKRLFCELINR